MLDPGQVIKRRSYVQFCCIDRKTRIVMRQRKAVQLGWMQFALFYCLRQAQRNGRVRLTSKEIWDEIYSGTRPAGYNIIPQVARQTNEKLVHLGLKIVGTNKREHSYYSLVLL